MPMSVCIHFLLSLWIFFSCFYIYLWGYEFDSSVFIVAFTDCPGPQSESAGKSDACEGCPNQQICATAPKGPDPGTLSLPPPSLSSSYALMLLSNNNQNSNQVF